MVIQLSAVSKIYSGKLKALDQVDLVLNSGHSYGLLGKNGAGKSTLINILIDLIEPSTGLVTFDGQSLSQSSEIRRRLGVMSDVIPPIADFTGWQNLEFAAKLYKLDHSSVKDRIQSLLEFFFEREDDWHKPVKSYSTGMRRKIALCVAIIHMPHVLIMDEPFSGLDPFSAKDIVRFVQQYQREDRIILTSSHDLDYVNRVVDQILVIDHGKLISNTSLEAFIEHGSGQIDAALFNILSSEEKSFESLDWLFSES
jgi:ABC-type multidrug transport system ATPase subunit